MEQINSLCGQNGELLIVKTGGTYRIHNASLKSWLFRKTFPLTVKVYKFWLQIFFRNVFRSHKCLAIYVTVSHTEARDVSTCHARRFMRL